MDTNTTIITATVQVRAVWGGADAVEVGVLTLKKKKDMDDEKRSLCVFSTSRILRGLSGLFLSR